MSSNALKPALAHMVMNEPSAPPPYHAVPSILQNGNDVDMNTPKKKKER